MGKESSTHFQFIYVHNIHTYRHVHVCIFENKLNKEYVKMYEKKMLTFIGKHLED